MTKKLCAILLSAVLLFSVFSVPAFGCFEKTEPEKATVNVENMFNQTLDVVIHKVLKILNIFWPGYDGDWTQKDDYNASDFYSGEDEFDTKTSKNSAWYLGYAGASLLEGIDVMNGEFFLAGSLEVFEGRVPTEVCDDQRVRVYAISDGTSGIVLHAVIDGFGLSRGDVQEIRSRITEYASVEGINVISVNVSVLHQHSCIDTLGMNIPLLPALILNTGNAMFGGLFDRLKVTKNQEFMENLFTKTVDCMVTAIESMEKGNLYYGNADISEYMRDARDPISFDSNIHRLRFVPNNGGKETWILQGSMHCTGFGAGPEELTADYPYYIEKAINEKVGANVVYVIGAELAIKMEKDLTNDPDATDLENLANYGYAVADKVMAIDNDIKLAPVLNIAHKEVSLDVDNGILTLAAREDILNAVIVKDGRDYVLVTEIGYMELGNEVGIFLCPGEFDPLLIFGGPESGDAAWSGESWDYAPLKDVANVDNVMVYGLCNDQAGYVLRDNEYHSLLSENEEVNIICRSAGSVFTEEYTNLINDVK